MSLSVELARALDVAERAHGVRPADRDRVGSPPFPAQSLGAHFHGGFCVGGARDDVEFRVEDPVEQHIARVPIAFATARR